MNTQNNNKRKYIVPVILQIKLDNDISLVLDSAPPTYESSNNHIAPEYFNNDPFKSNVV